MSVAKESSGGRGGSVETSGVSPLLHRLGRQRQNTNIHAAIARAGVPLTRPIHRIEVDGAV